jgi:integrase
MVWTAQQTGAFLDHAAREDPQVYPLLHLIAYRGLRRGEVVGLREDDVALDRAQLSVTQQIVNLGTALRRTPPKSRAGHRTLGLDAATVTVLRAARASRPQVRDRSLFFVASDGQAWHPDALSRRFRRLLAGTTLPPVRLYDLRHGAATLSLAAGVDIKVVQATLGHSSVTLTADTYTSVLPEVDQAAAEAIATLIPRRTRPAA